MDIGANYLGNGKTRFRVWAPLKEKMILHIVHPFEKKIELQKNGDGYFCTETDLHAGGRYFYMDEEGNDIPDPASQSQPEGVHGPSEIIDHSDFTWHDKQWKGIPFSELILYEMHVGTFTEAGTFEAAIARLDHLVATGINTVELMPVSQFPGKRNWGYDGVFPYAVQNSYGGVNGLKKFVNACHQRGIAVFLDVVYNHLGPEGNYFEKFAPYFTDHYKTPWGRAINFDGEWSDGVRDFFSDNALYWFEEFHIDGLRFDAIHGVYDSSAIHFWNLLHEKIRKLEQRLGRKLHTIAESDFNNPVVIRSAETGGFGFTAQWLDDFHHALYVLLDEKGKKMYVDFGKSEQLAKAYKDGFVHSGEFVKFRKRKHGVSSAGISGEKFVVFIENHDQAGNRVTGDRLAKILDLQKLKIASAAFLLSPYIPMLFMGEEYGEVTPFFYFIDHSDKELIKAVQQGRKKEFEHLGWETEPADPQAEKTFLDSKLKWGKLADKKHQNIWQWYRQLIQLRKTHPALKNFNKNDVWVNVVDETLVLYRRSADEKSLLLCFFNFATSHSTTYTLPAEQKIKTKLIDSNNNEEVNDKAGLPVTVFETQQNKITIPPLSVCVFQLQSNWQEY